MEKLIKAVLTLLLFTGAGKTIHAQANTADIIQRTMNKIQVIQNNYRVIERTFGDMIFRDDSLVTSNRIYTHTFSSSNTYHLNAFASSQDVSDINIAIYMKVDDNQKAKFIASDNSTGSDASLKFDPTVNSLYYIVISGTLKNNINNTFFNLIVDRE